MDPRPHRRTASSRLAVGPSTSFPFAPSQPGSLAVTPHSSHVFPTSQPSPVRRPPMSRAHSHSLSLHSKPYSLNTGASSPFFLTPQPSSVNVSAPRTLLMPTVRQTRHATATAPPSPKPQSQRSPRSGLSRSRTSSVVPGTANPPDSICTTSLPDWIGGGCRFEVVADNIYLEGYQLYAVEKWVVERSRPVTVLAVFTGDPRHRIAVTALSPLSTLSPSEATAEWEKALHHLRRDGARPKDTERGVIMVTSLANFRSDFTIVHIPKGDFLDVREQLYSNINVLRMGCSGRSALTLGEPSDTTKDRFLSMYHLSDNVLARTQAVFNSTVLEFIKLIQTSLAICGMFPLLHDERNGLLCDVTLEGIHTWVTDIGEPLMEMEPLERTLDPAVVAALFSTILTIRIKLQALGHPVPKDPLIDPMSFIKSLHSFQSSLKPNSHSHSISLSHHSSHNAPVPPTSSTLSSSTTPSTLSPAGAPGDGTLYLTYPLILAISSAYDKLKQSESYKVHRVLINKLDDLATDLRTSESSKSKSKSGGWWGQGNAFNNNQPSSDLAVFVKCVVSGAGAASTSSLRYLWTGRPEEVGRKRREKEVLEDGELAGEGDGKGDKDKDKEKEKEKAEKEKDKEREREGGKERMSYDRDVKSSEDEGDLGGYSTSKPWSGRVQRKIEVWTALGRAKKLSADFGAKGRAFVSPESLPGATQSTTQLLPSVVISRDPADEDDVLSSGQVSPVYSQRLSMMRGLGVYPNSQRSANELLEYDRRVTEFDARRPPTKSQFQTRIISWSDPVTARGLLDDEDSTPFGGSGRKRPSPLHDSVLGGDNDDMQSGTGTLVEDDGEGEGSLGSTDIRRQRTILLKKRRSFDDADRVRDTVRLLTPERMRIDVELCGQLLILRRREAHLANVIACLQALTRSLSTTNASLRNDYDAKQEVLSRVEERVAVLQGVEGMRVQADAVSQETQALAYESAQFLVEELWHMANQPRQKVLELREKVFGTGVKRSSRGQARGRFNRVQVMLDGREVYVDELGRTESEAEEEERFGVPRRDLPVDHSDTASTTSAGGEGEGEVEHPSLRPTWVLRMFNYWGRGWGAGRKGASKVAHPVENCIADAAGAVRTEDGPAQQQQVPDDRPQSPEAQKEIGANVIPDSQRASTSTAVDAWGDTASRRKPHNTPA